MSLQNYSVTLSERNCVSAQWLPSLPPNPQGGTVNAILPPWGLGGSEEILFG